jgi:hypothetical protein
MRENQTAIVSLFLILIQLVCLTVAAAQQQTPANFQWNWRDSQELSATQNLAKANTPDADKREIAAAIAARLRPNDDNGSGLRPHNAALATRVKFTDLNHDEVPEVVAQSMADCSPTGNCSIWVFQKRSHGYKMLLKGFGQAFTIQKSRTNGYNDIVLAAHDSAFDSGLTVFQYSDGAYADTACYFASWRVLQRDSYVDLKEPRITPCR